MCADAVEKLEGGSRGYEGFSLVGDLLGGTG